MKYAPGFDANGVGGDSPSVGGVRCRNLRRRKELLLEFEAGVLSILKTKQNEHIDLVRTRKMFFVIDF